MNLVARARAECSNSGTDRCVLYLAGILMRYIPRPRPWLPKTGKSECAVTVDRFASRIYLLRTVRAVDSTVMGTPLGIIHPTIGGCTDPLSLSLAPCPSDMICTRAIRKLSTRPAAPTSERYCCTA